jgi:hypothetical protein
MTATSVEAEDGAADLQGPLVLGEGGWGAHQPSK